MKKYKIKKSKKIIDGIKKYWHYVDMAESYYYGWIDKAEKAMSKATGIKDIELFMCDGDIVGVGNVSRTMPLVTIEDIEAIDGKG